MDETINKNEERIDRYLHGEMSSEEEKMFEAELDKDETLRRQAETTARIVKGMDAVGAEQDALLIEQMKASSEKKLAPVWGLSIAAGFAILLTVGYHFYDRSATMALGREYASVFPTETIVRGEEDEAVSKELTSLFDNAANGKDLDNTIEQLEKLWKLSKSDTYNGYTTYEPYIGWNLAIAHLCNNDKKEAKAILDEMQLKHPEGSAMGDKIFELREKL